MILVVNCFNEEAFAADFDQVVAGHFEAAGHPCGHLAATGIAAAGDLSGYSHLVISGSVASATEAQPWDQPLGGLVRQFVAARKPVLGICYGHQFLAKVLAGPRHVRRRHRHRNTAPGPVTSARAGPADLLSARCRVAPRHR